jgi:hydroxymethylpyrimidine/phosphomethylpyrimidine kinase
LLLPAALPRAAVAFVVVLFVWQFGENATSGQEISVTGFNAKAFILLANDSLHHRLSCDRIYGKSRLLRTCNMKARRNGPPAVLTIAGSDSGGGAGIQADLRTFAAHGVHGLCVITAVTAQNTRIVAAIETMPPRIVEAQLDAVFSDFEIRAVKIGMLATPAIVRAVAGALTKRPHVPVVLDPVLVATTGGRLSTANLAPALRRHLLKRADLVTPNVPEAESLLDRRLRTADDLASAADDLIGLGARAVLLKGGHLAGRRVRDLLALADGTRRTFEHARIDAEGHGTGCTLSAAIAANLALGDSMEAAIERAIEYVHRAMADGYEPGKGKLRVLEHRVRTR